MHGRWQFGPSFSMSGVWSMSTYSKKHKQCFARSDPGLPCAAACSHNGQRTAQGSHWSLSQDSSKAFTLPSRLIAVDPMTYSTWIGPTL